MGNVDDHPQFIHPLHHFYPERLQSLFHHVRIPSVWAPDTVFIIPCQRDQTDPILIEPAQSFEPVIQNAPFFQGQNACDAFSVLTGKRSLPQQTGVSEGSEVSDDLKPLTFLRPRQLRHF